MLNHGGKLLEGSFFSLLEGDYKERWENEEPDMPIYFFESAKPSDQNEWEIEGQE